MDELPTGTGTVGALIRGARRRARLSLEGLAQRAGCARSHLSQIETGKRRAGEELLVRLEESLGLASGVLVGAAGLSRAPDVLRKRVSDLEVRTAAARRLADILRGSGIGEDGSIRGALDVAHRTGELERLVGVISPGDRGGTGGSTGNTKGATGRDGETGGGDEGAGGVLPVGRVMPRVVPLINAVAAGSPAEFTDLGYPARIADEYVRTEEIDDPDAFAARVVGDSMSPDYREGDVVVFSPVLAAASGDDCFARLEPDHESTFKRAFFETDGKGREVVRLQPLNPAYAARVVRREEVAGLYPAVAVQRKVRRG
ncbi:MAG: LexA family transcriptional regulator [Phycisphaeraceae bacterium]|nr:LexA family transcriptional regulator [Phycisphaeraceae bacterium]